MKSCPEPVMDNEKRASIIRLAALCFCGWLASPSLGAVEYELQGVAHDEPRALDIHFQLCVRDCLWRIRCWHEDGRGLHFDTALLASNTLIRVMEFSTQHWATAVIEPTPIPTGCEESATSLLWLLLASGCSWDSNGSGRITPVYDPLTSGVMDRERRQLAHWELSPNPPFLPQRVIYLNEGLGRLWDSRTQRATEFALAPPYDQGFTNAAGWITETSLVEGLTLPRAFVFEQYGKAKDRPGLSLRVTRRLSGRVDTARARCSHSDLVPRPGFRTAVQDRRLMATGAAGPVTYSVPSGVWPDMGQLRRIWKRQQRAGGLPSAVQIALFCALALAPLAAIFWHRRNKG